MSQVSGGDDMGRSPEDEEDPRVLRALAAALLEADGITEEGLDGIASAFRAHLLRDATWELVLAGRIGVSWDEAIQQPRFFHLDDAEVRRRRSALRKHFPDG
jgi:hypothetical protein